MSPGAVSAVEASKVTVRRCLSERSEGSEAVEAEAVRRLRQRVDQSAARGDMLSWVTRVGTALMCQAFGSYSTTISTGVFRATTNSSGSERLSFIGWWTAAGGT